eukprot:scaffold14653_cov66-Phaeocystis_antarctica.AAC.5
MARSPRQRSVGASTAAAAKSSVATGKPYASGQTPASVATMVPAPNPDHKTTPVAHATRIARASVGKRARPRRKRPSGNGTNHHGGDPTASPIDWPVLSTSVGVALITNRAHPACTMAKLTRSRRPAADARASRNTPLTAAELAAPEGVLRAADVANREGEVVAPWTPTLGSASAPRRSRRQPARPRSSRVGSRAMAIAAAKAIACLQIFSKRGRGVAAGAQAGELGLTPRERVEAHTAVARQSPPLPGPGVNPRAVLLVAGIVVRLALVPVGEAGSVTRHAAAPTLGRAEPRLVLVEPEPQAIRRSELCRDEVILLRRAHAGRCAPVLPAQIHAAEERGGALVRHDKAARAPRGVSMRGSPAGWAGSRDEREEEEGGGRQRVSRNYEIVVAHAEVTWECTQRLACAHRHGTSNRAVPRRRQHGHSRILVAEPLERLGTG